MFGILNAFVTELVLGSVEQSELYHFAVLTPAESQWAIEHTNTYDKFFAEDWPESVFERKEFRDGRKFLVSKRVLARDVFAFRNEICQHITRRPQKGDSYLVSDFDSKLGKKIDDEFMKMTNSRFRGFASASLLLSPRIDFVIVDGESRRRVSIPVAELCEFSQSSEVFQTEESPTDTRIESSEKLAADEFDELVLLPFGWRTHSTLDISEEILKSLYAERSELETQNSDLVTQVLAQWSKTKPEFSWQKLRVLSGTKINDYQSSFRQVFEKRFSDLAGDEHIEAVFRGVALELNLGGGRSLILDLGTEKNWN